MWALSSSLSTGLEVLGKDKQRPRSGTPEPSDADMHAKNNSKPTKTSEAFGLLEYHEIPSWQQDNQYILSGYRPTSGSVAKSLQSLFYIHNETVNIYSHVIGAALFTALPYLFRSDIHHSYTNAEPTEFIVLTIYALGVATCFALSSTCHIVWNSTPAWAFYGNQLDYLGIIILMSSASAPTIFFGFRDEPQLQKTHWILMALASAACAATTLSPRFRSPRLRPHRAATYAALGLAGAAFIAHGVARHGWAVQRRRMALDWMAAMAAANLVGAAVYAARVPERCFPRRFDVCGASHQLFHILVVVAALLHFAGLLRAVEHARAL